MERRDTLVLGGRDWLSGSLVLASAVAFGFLPIFARLAYSGGGVNGDQELGRLLKGGGRNRPTRYFLSRVPFGPYGIIQESR